VRYGLVSSKKLGFPVVAHVDQRIKAAWAYGVALIEGGEYPDVDGNRADRSEILDSGEV
jgi:hypothetical protein